MSFFVSQLEMEAKIIFSQIDTDGSGGLDRDEFIEALKVPG